MNINKDLDLVFNHIPFAIEDDEKKEMFREIVNRLYELSLSPENQLMCSMMCAYTVGIMHGKRIKKEKI